MSAYPSDGMTNLYYDEQLLHDIGVQLVMSQGYSYATSYSGIKTHNCSICNKPISADSMRGHIAYHILSDHVSSDVCSFCGLTSCINKLIRTSKHNDKIYYWIDLNGQLSLVTK